MSTASPTRFDQIHLYLDESGVLHGEPDETDLPLVGGVALLGGAAAADGPLLALLREATEEVGGTFPGDLHSRHEPFSRVLGDGVRDRLAAWPAGRDVLAGFVIRHEEDLAPEGGLLTAETRADNRYQRMLVELLQHVLFVSPWTRARLAADAAVFLHLASRVVVFQPGQATRPQLEALGHRVRDRAEQPGSLRVPLSLGPPEAGALFRGVLQQNWPHTALRPGGVPEVIPIHYDPAGGPSPAGLYLADLLLWRARRRFRGRGGPALALPGLLPAETVLAYGPALDRQTRRHAALARGNVDAYLLLRREPDDPEAASSDGAAVLAEEEALAARLMGEGNRTPEGLAEFAARVADEPGQGAAGRVLAETALRLNDQLPHPDDRTRLHALQALMSAANHAGDVAESRRLWEEYRQAERRLGVSQEAYRFAVEMRNRWAVSLT